MNPLSGRAVQARLTLTATMTAVALAVAACAGAVAAPAQDDEPVAGPGSSAGMCAPEVPDCVDVEVDADADREAATDLLGTAEADLPAEVRVGRRGDEHIMLTEDYVVGRMTVELDADDNGTFRVVKVVLEAFDGPETFASGD